MRLHARLNLNSLPGAGPEQRLPADPVEPTPPEYPRPDETPKPWKEATSTVSSSMSGDGRHMRGLGGGGLTLDGPRHDVRIPTVLPEEELTAGLQEPIQIPGLLLWVRDRALRADRSLPKATQSGPARERQEGRGKLTSTCMLTTQSMLPSTMPYRASTSLSSTPQDTSVYLPSCPSAVSRRRSVKAGAKAVLGSTP